MTQKCGGEQLRFLNATDHDNVDFYMFNNLEYANAKPGNVSNYQKCPRGICTFKVCMSGKAGTLSSAFFDFKPEVSYIVCAVGKQNDISLYAFEEKPKYVDSNYAHFRVCLLTSKYELSNIYANGQAVICHMQPMDVSKYVAFLPGTYKLEIKPTTHKTDMKTKNSDTDDACEIIQSIHLNAGERYSVFVCEENTQNKLRTIIVL